MDASNSQDLGGKANALKTLEQAGYNIPSFVVLAEEETHHTETIKQRVESLSTPYFAVRSSANVEDGKEQSFAGIFTTELFVQRHDIVASVARVASSKESEELKAYTELHNIKLSDIRLNVIVQEMIDADCSGVAFGINPSKPYRIEKLVSAVYGLGEGLVSGQLDADHYTQKEKGAWKHDIASKNEQLVYDDGKLTYASVPEPSVKKACLTNEQLDHIAGVLDNLNQLYGTPQDIEFCFKDNVFYLLQSRPITTLTEVRNHVVWDNSNIIESYPGITSPFTFSFILDIYQSVYRNFASLLGVPQYQIEANKDVFAEMLGHIHGRVYYQLINWYKALAMLPMYSVNAGFMEKMMGVSEPLNVEIKLNKQPGKLESYWNTVKTLARLVRLNRALPDLKKQFTSKVDKTINQFLHKEYSNDDLHQVWNDYKEFKRLLVEEWSPPLANDLLAMIYFGSLQSFCTKWLGSESIHTELIIGKHDVVSVQPAKLINSIIHTAIDENRLDYIKSTDSQTVWQESVNKNLGETGELILHYVNRFGDRSVGELKLENETFRQNPSAFIDIIKTYTSASEQVVSIEPLAEKEVLNDLSPVKRKILSYLIRKASETVADRENLRFDRTRAFGVVRTQIRTLGRLLVNKNILEHVADVFYFKEEELEALVLGTLTPENCLEILHKRKREGVDHQGIEHLPERIHEYDGVLDIEYEQPLTPDQLKGIPCCPGVVHGKVRVLNNPKDVSSLDGDILVTTSTDPGWITIFQSASAILVERGSTLSHAAIVSREMGIPCIVGVKGLTQILKTGDVVEMDGQTGTITTFDHGK
ncbi:MAG: hypothetical protein JJ975_13230 [Bacteroidia bacterium]|nr:hypothetical protein [Bacteroidia bacterium]